MKQILIIVLIFIGLNTAAQNPFSSTYDSSYKMTKQEATGYIGKRVSGAWVFQVARDTFKLRYDERGSLATPAGDSTLYIWSGLNWYKASSSGETYHLEGGALYTRTESGVKYLGTKLVNATDTGSVTPEQKAIWDAGGGVIWQLDGTTAYYDAGNVRIGTPGTDLYSLNVGGTIYALEDLRTSGTVVFDTRGILNFIDNNFYIENGLGKSAILDMSGMTSAHNYLLPNTDGTIALTSDIAPTPSFQQTTDIGNTTTNTINVNTLAIKDQVSNTHNLSIGASGGIFGFNNSDLGGSAFNNFDGTTGKISFRGTGSYGTTIGPELTGNNFRITTNGVARTFITNTGLIGFNTSTPDSAVTFGTGGINMQGLYYNASPRYKMLIRDSITGGVAYQNIPTAGGVTSFNSRTGAVIPSAGDYNNITETLTNKTIAAGSNTITGLTNSNLSGSAGITNVNLANSTITIAGNSTALGGSVTQDAITGLSSTGLIKRTGSNTLSIATAGTDYATPASLSDSLAKFRSANQGDTVDITISNSTSKEIFFTSNPSIVKTSQTITTVSAPFDGQEIYIAFGGTINASGAAVVNQVNLTANTGQGIVGRTTFFGADTNGYIILKYKLSNTKWYVRTNL
jgi:hypothetical protein